MASSDAAITKSFWVTGERFRPWRASTLAPARSSFLTPETKISSAATPSCVAVAIAFQRSAAGALRRAISTPFR